MILIQSGKVLKKILASFIMITPVFSGYSYAEVDLNFSGFGTLGYAVSNKSYNYLKDISDDGSFYHDSILGGQLDLQINSKLSATMQAQAEASSSEDEAWDADIALAFLSYRPTNDWMFRGGKLRVPGYLNSENRDIGVTYDYARIPVEFDSLAPTYDYWGISINKTFLLSNGDLSLDTYYGKIDSEFRTYFRNDVPGSFSAGSFYSDIEITVVGESVTYQTTDNIYIASIHYADSSNKSNSYTWYDSPLYENGYYTYEGASEADSMYFIFVNVGADILLGNDFRLAGELAARRILGDFVNGQNGYTGYVSLRKPIGNWTPYVFYSQLKSDSEQLALYQSLNQSSIDNNDPSQTAMADIYQAYDQYSVALGTSYNLSPTSKIKAEIMLTHIGEASSLIDAPSGSYISDTDITVFSLSYSFAF